MIVGERVVASSMGKREDTLINPNFDRCQLCSNFWTFLSLDFLINFTSELTHKPYW